MNADEIFKHIPSPLGLLLVACGAWAWLWDARESYLLGNFLDARVSRTAGIIYVVLGAAIWISRRALT